MKLQNRDHVVISREKLLKYILSETHSLGRFKAKYFESMGFNMRNVDALEKCLRSIAKTQQVKDTISSKYGTKYVLEGAVETPNGKTVKLCTVWIIEKEQTRPRFVTTYPV